MASPTIGLSQQSTLSLLHIAIYDILMDNSEALSMIVYVAAQILNYALATWFVPPLFYLFFVALVLYASFDRRVFAMHSNRTTLHQDVLYPLFTAALFYIPSILFFGLKGDPNSPSLMRSYDASKTQYLGLEVFVLYIWYTFVTNAIAAITLQPIYLRFGKLCAEQTS